MDSINKIRISIVSYLNTLPFVYGIKNSGLINQIELSLDNPAECARKLNDNKADIGLIPVAAIADLNESYVITDYCIGGIGKINSVILASDVPIEKIKFVFPDYQSLTSNQLLKILMQHHWNISPRFLESHDGYESQIKNDTAGLIIGDRALMMRKKFAFVYDLGEAWFEMTSLPFVFACWTANKKLPDSFIAQFNEALRFGLSNIEAAAMEYDKFALPADEIKSYLENNISYQLDDSKRKGMKLFFDYLKKGKEIGLNAVR